MTKTSTTKNKSQKNIIQFPKLIIEPWKEVVGDIFDSTTKGDTFYLGLKINGKQYCLHFKKGSKELMIIKKALHPPLRNLKLAILYTDDPDDPIRVNRIEGV